MRAYYYDNIPGDQRLLHDSGNPVEQKTLKSIGVLHWSIPIDENGTWELQINQVAKDRDYKNRDTINVTKEGLGDLYESKINIFFEEWVLCPVLVKPFTYISPARHMHEDEEIRYILSGSGFFDVRGACAL